MAVIKIFVWGKNFVTKELKYTKLIFYFWKKKRHRHPSSHICKSLIEDEQKKMNRKVAAQEKVAKTFSYTSEPKRQKIKSVPIKSKNGGMVELMKMKSQAKGSASVPTTSRIYLYVQCPKGSTLELQSVYFDKVYIFFQYK